MAEAEAKAKAEGGERGGGGSDGGALAQRKAELAGLEAELMVQNRWQRGGLAVATEGNSVLRVYVFTDGEDTDSPGAYRGTNGMNVHLRRASAQAVTERARVIHLTLAGPLARKARSTPAARSSGNFSSAAAAWSASMP